MLSKIFIPNCYGKFNLLLQIVANLSFILKFEEKMEIYWINELMQYYQGQLYLHLVFNIANYFEYA